MVCGVVCGVVYIIGLQTRYRIMCGVWCGVWCGVVYIIGLQTRYRMMCGVWCGVWCGIYNRLADEV